MSERERLLGRVLPPTPFALQVDYTPEALTARDELDAARAAHRHAVVAGADLDDVGVRLAAARAAFDPHCMTLQVKVIPADEYERLELSNPPTPEQAERGEVWNFHAFAPQLLAACVEGDMTAEDWTVMRQAGGVATAGEINALLRLCLAVNDRTPDPHLGKD